MLVQAEVVPGPGRTWAVCRRDAALVADLELGEDHALETCGESRWVAAPEPLCTRASPESSVAAARLDPPEAPRQRPAGRGWTLAWDERLDAADRLALDALAADLRLASGSLEAGFTTAGPCLPITGPGMTLPYDLYVRALPHAWQLVWGPPASDDAGLLTMWRGITVNPRATRARGRARARRRPVLGCHLGLTDFPADRGALRELIAGNPSLFFLFVDVPGSRGPAPELVAGLENAAYAGSAGFGEASELHARFDVVWLPPLAEAPAAPIDAHYRTSLALAYAIGRPLVAPRRLRFTPAPYQYYYHPDESLDFIAALARTPLDPAVLDRYLTAWTPVHRFRRLLRYADCRARDSGRRRPDPDPAGHVVATTWPAARPRRHAGRVLLATDTLDTGGLEEMVAQQARHLPRLGADVAVLCVERGGATATRLKGEGVRVHEAGGDPRVIRDVLSHERPTLVHSQLAGIALLESAADRGVPVLETIQNTYVWFDRALWRTEARRSRCFTRAAAVSALVRRYYAKWNPAFSPDWVTVLPNSVDPDRLALVDRAAARRALGIADDDVVFLTLASYAPQKNQIGLLTAFDAAAHRNPRARLLCAGSVPDPGYQRRVAAHRRKLRSRSRIELHPFRQDTGVLLSAADVFVLDSFFEGWSVAATEALVAGLPLIHSDCGGGRELVGAGGERGIVVPNPAGHALDLTWETLSPLLFRERHRNTGPLVDAISRMVEERADWRQRAGEIRAQAIEMFGVAAWARRYEALFQEATGHL